MITLITLSIGAAAGIWLWAIFVPDKWQFKVKDVADDVYEVVRAWAIELRRRVRERRQKD